MQVQLRDQFGNPTLSTDVITVEANGPGPLSNAEDVSVAAVAGVAVFPGLSLQRSGSHRLVASSGLLPTRSSVTFEVSPASTRRSSRRPVLPQAVTVNQIFAVPLRAKVTDVFGNAIPAASVLFTTPEAGPSAVLSAAPPTDALGVTRVTAAANTLRGQYAVTAKVGDASADFNLTNLGRVSTLTLETSPMAGVLQWFAVAARRRVGHERVGFAFGRSHLRGRRSVRG